MGPLHNQYLKEQAGQDARRPVALPIVATDDSSKVLGFYILSSKSIQLTDIPHELSRRLPRYPHLPATLLDRLTTDLSARGVGLARFLLIDAMVRAVKSEIAPVAFIVDAKDEAAVRFYERESFLRLPEGRTRLLRRMSDIEAVLRS